MSGSIQSSNYVPGVSGWKLNPLTGELEINSWILGGAANAPERQMVSVEVASWSKCDLPKIAANLLQFMQAELERVPEQYRHAAEFEEFDASYGDDSFNSRLFLSYARLETEEELADRLEKVKVAGTRASIKNGLMTVIHDGVVRYKIGKLDQPEPEQPKPFKVDGDKVYVSEAFIREAVVTNANIGFYVPIAGAYVDADGRVRINREDLAVDAKIDGKLAAKWSIRMQINANGQYVAAGVGLGISDAFDSQFLTSADAFAIKERSAQEVLDKISTVIGESSLAADLESPIPGIVRDTIRAELRPGGLLHRSR